MFKALRRIGNGIVGAFAGAIGGFAAGFVPGYYYLLRKGSSLWTSSQYSAPIVSLFWLGIYLATLPFFIAFRTGYGIVHGIINGPQAGITYPKTLNDEHKLDRANKKLLRALKALNTDNDYLLSANEIAKMRKILANYPDNLAAFDKNLKNYQEYLASMGAENSAQLKNPVVITTKKAGNGPGNVMSAPSYHIVDHSFLLAEAKRHQAKLFTKSTPVTIVINGETHHVIDANQMQHSHPAMGPIFYFIKDTRNIIALETNNTELQRQLGATSGLARVEAIDERSVESREVRIAKLRNELAALGAATAADETTPLLDAPGSTAKLRSGSF